MYARVARFEGAEGEALTRTTDEIRKQAEEAGGPPPGVPASRLLVLRDTDGGKALVITLFASEADYEEGDRTLSGMSPPNDGMGQRVGIDKYEVAIEVSA